MGSVDTPGDARDLAVLGGRAYVADGAGGLQIIDVGNPQAPVILGSLNTAGAAVGVDVSGNLAVIAEGTSGIQRAGVTISADASNNVAVDRVVFSVNGVVQFEDTAAPYSFIFGPAPGVTSLTIDTKEALYPETTNSSGVREIRSSLAQGTRSNLSAK